MVLLPLKADTALKKKILKVLVFTSSSPGK